MEKHPTETINQKVLEECHQLLNEINCCPSNYKLIRSLRVLIRNVVVAQNQTQDKKASFRLEIHHKKKPLPQGRGRRT